MLLLVVVTLRGRLELVELRLLLVRGWVQNAQHGLRLHRFQRLENRHRGPLRLLLLLLLEFCLLLDLHGGLAADMVRLDRRMVF